MDTIFPQQLSRVKAMAQLVTSTRIASIAALAAGFLAAFAFFWAFLCLFLGGPEGHIGRESTIAGLISLVLGALLAYAAYILFVAPKRMMIEPCPAIYRHALAASPALILLFTGLLFVLAPFMVIYLIVVIAIVILIKLVAR